MPKIYHKLWRESGLTAFETAALLDFTEKLLSYKIRQFTAQDPSKTLTSDSICGLYLHVLDHGLAIQ